MSERQPREFDPKDARSFALEPEDARQFAQEFASMEEELVRLMESHLSHPHK